jgi:hypothetical protein
MEVGAKMHAGGIVKYERFILGAVKIQETQLKSTLKRTGLQVLRMLIGGSLALRVFRDFC